MTRRLLTTCLALLASLGAFGAIGASSALAGAPHWRVITRSAPTRLQPGEPGQIVTLVANLGSAPVIATKADPVVIDEELPEHVIATGSAIGEADAGAVEGPEKVKCSGLRCTYEGEIPPYVSLQIQVPVRAEEGFTAGTNTVRVEGANVLTQPTSEEIRASSSPTQFGVERYELTAEEEGGTTDLTAGSHPFQLTTTLELNQTFREDPSHEGLLTPAAPVMLRNADTTLPAGLVGDPVSVPQCSGVDFSTIRLGDSDLCPPDTAVGVAIVTFKEPLYFAWQTEAVPIFNLEPALGEPARFGFEFAKVPVTIDTSVRTGDGYAVEADVSDASESAEVLGTFVSIWGVPGEASHDDARGWECLGDGFAVSVLASPPPCLPLNDHSPVAYLTLPTSCSGLSGLVPGAREEGLPTYVRAQSWEPGASFEPAVEGPSQPLTGCNALPFNPAVNVAPDEHTASTPSGYTVEVSLPQNTTLAANGKAEADVYATELAFPEGVQTNAGAADGLETCSVAAAGFDGAEGEQGAALEGQLADQLFTSAAASCPNAAKIGEVSIHTPLLAHELKGALYLGSQDTDPFETPLVTYIVAEDPISGVRVKLAGETRISATGQLTSVFRNTPPVPFETLKLHLFNGPRASLTTPPYCRGYESVAKFTPWSGEEAATRSSSFTPEAGPDGGACQSGGPLPFTPSVVAGSTDDQAAAFTSFSLTVGHPDGDQPLKQISVRLPEGLAGILANVPLCAAAQAEAGSCPESSLVGESRASAGLGPDTVTLPGKVYLTGAIKGAPFGLLDVTEAKAGPFNLGDVDVLSTITVNEFTAAVTVTSEPLPQYVKGVPSQIKELNVIVNRPNFQFNPTNCTPTSVGGSLTGYEGGVSPIDSSFDVANCANLPFKPKLTASVGAKASKVGGVTFEVTVESPGLGQANIHKVLLQLPESLPSRNTTIQKACLEKVFDENPAACDEGSVIGYGIVHTPVFKNPLTGPAYLVSHGGAAFPDVEFVLQGEGIKLILDGKTDIKKINGAEVTFSKFESSPDAPFTKFESVLPEGPHSALTSYVPKDEYNLCAATNLVMPTTIIGQNGAVIEQNTQITTKGCASSSTGTTTKTKQLAAALKACKKQKAKKKRAACEASARKRYGVRIASTASRLEHAGRRSAGKR